MPAFNTAGRVGKPLSRTAKTVIFDKSPQLTSHCPGWLRNFKQWQNHEKSFELEKISEGGYGAIYLARSLDSRNACVLKTYSKDLLRSRPHYKAKVLREWGLHSGLAHPNIIEAYVGFEDRRWVGIAMEYAGEHDAIAWMESQGKEAMTESEAKGLVFDMLSALDYLHAQGVVHRDVKPENFYRTDEGRWKLGDFGSAVEVEALEEGEALHPEGTLSYSAPEYVKLWRQSTSGSVRDCTGPQLDVWSIGATAYDLISGCPPFQTEDSTDDDEKEAILSTEPSFPAATFSAAATSFIQSALQKSPKDRPTAAELMSHRWLSS